MQRDRRIGQRIVAGLVILSGMAAGVPSRAGGGPQNVVLVVNDRSEGSKRVANHYARLRQVPASNVVYLDYDGPTETIHGKPFREQILTPVLQAIDDRGLSAQADVIAYSTDFPWRVNFAKDFNAKEKPFARGQKPTASITGATYLFAFVNGRSRGLVSPYSNLYLAPTPGLPASRNLVACQDVSKVVSRGFRGRYVWGTGGKRVAKADQGARYLMSTMLGVTTGRGNTVDEVIQCLDRAAQADLSPPEGSFVFMRRENAPRSTPRHNCYSGAVEELRRLGSHALVQPGTMPKQPITVAGLMAGASNLTFGRGLRIEPGAICDHLTSFGGDLRKETSQTPLSEFIRAGAAGASGTVTEPLAMAAKFPLPSLQVHYRRGCSLAEAFYQSVAGPYQLLIVGDPLCQPWAQRPGLQVAGWPLRGSLSIQPGTVSTFGFEDLGISTADPDDDADKQGALTITPRVTPTAGEGACHWELFVDGRLRMRLGSGRKVSLTAEQLGPGWHELACVGMNPDAIESQRIQAGSIEILETPDGPIEPVRMRVDRQPDSTSPRLAVSAEAPGAERIIIRQNLREVARIDGDSGGAFIDAARLGKGPVRLQAVAEPSGAASPPVWTQVD